MLKYLLGFFYAYTLCYNIRRLPFPNIFSPLRGDLSCCSQNTGNGSRSFLENMPKCEQHDSHENKFINRIIFPEPGTCTSIEPFHLGESPRPGVETKRQTSGTVEGNSPRRKRKRPEDDPVPADGVWCPLSAFRCVIPDSCDTCIFKLFMEYER